MSQNYKDTLLLPKTDFPMKADLIKREPERLAKWEAAGLYWQVQAARKDAPLFVLHDGPPFANGDVHMGTALNKILKDLVVKSRTMLGLRAPFVPGWDCHGLPIEFKVVKESRGLTPAEVRRRAEEFARKYIDIQRRQFKRLGVLGDWENPYLTLAPTYEAEVLRTFAIFVEKGLVYQSKKPVYWSTGAQTALAEAEVEYKQRVDPAVYVKFRLDGSLADQQPLNAETSSAILREKAQALEVRIDAEVLDYLANRVPANMKLLEAALTRVASYVTLSGQQPATGKIEDLLKDILQDAVRRSHETGGSLSPVSMVVWTTTPWTLPANVAIAVHPKAEYLCAEFEAGDGRTECLVVAKALLEKFEADTGLKMKKRLPLPDLIGKRAQHPFLPRKSLIIGADFVTMDTGTGQVHIAPGHGADDYIAGKQNNLPILSPVDDQGRLTDECGMPQWVGKYVFDANADIVAFLRENGSLLAEQPYTHDYPHCWRSKTPIVFRAVEQFFIKVDAIRADALAAIDKVNWLPPWGRNRIYGTVESRPDWCISRQRTWGVPLPVFYTADGAPILDATLARRVADIVEKEGTNVWFEKTDEEWAKLLGLPAGTTRRNDTLDVWIDSGVSHTAVMKRRPELGGGTADVYLEATDQHRGWFQSSLMTSIAMTGAAPYKTVITHGFVVDKDGAKISKSSSYQKPMDAEHFVGQYGADVVRLWVSSVDYQNEVPFSEEAFTRLGEAYRSFRNILRILLANLHDFDPAQASLDGATTIDRWMLSRLQEVIATCREAYEAYDFRKVFQTLNQFVTVDISALYVDITKDRLYCDAANAPRRRATQTVMHRVFESLARLLAPILVYTADESWEFAPHSSSASPSSPSSPSIHIETFPTVDPAFRDEKLEAEIESWLKIRAVVAQSVEPARQQKLIGNALEAAVMLEVADPAQLALLQARKDELEEFIILSDLTLAAGAETKSSLTRTAHKKCSRCWRFRANVGLSAAHPELCDRCAAVVGG